MEILVDGKPHRLLKVHHRPHSVKLFVGIEDYVCVPRELWDSARAFTVHASGRLVEILDDGE